MSESPAAYYPEIQAVARKLRAVCDGGMTLDGLGFSRAHARFGRVLAHAPVELWSPGLAAKGAAVLSKYGAQLPAADIGTLKRIRAELPFVEAGETKPVLGIERGRLAIVAEAFGVDDFRRKETRRVAEMLGFVYDRKEAAWFLERPVEPGSYEENIVALEIAGWHVLPAATGIFSSWIGDARNAREKWDDIRRAGEVRAHMKQVASRWRVTRGGYTLDGLPCFAIHFMLTGKADAKDLLRAMFGDRIVFSRETGTWVLSRPTPTDYVAAHDFATDRGIATWRRD